MDSIVIQLQQEALDRNVNISDLLRKALVVSCKLNIKEIENWIMNELNGYTNPKDIPDYRKISGEIKWHNVYHGWQPVIFEDPSTAEALSEHSCTQSVAEIENLLSGSNNGNSLHISFPKDLELQLMKGMGSQRQIALRINPSVLAAILDTIRTTILNWALKLEENNIRGEGFSFTKEEKQTATTIPSTVNIFHAPVTNSQIQQGTNPTMVLHSSDLNVPLIQSFLDMLIKQSDSLKLSADHNAELHAEIKTVEAQIKSPKPKENIVKEGLSSIKNILEGTAAGVAAPLLIELGKFFLPH